MTGDNRLLARGQMSGPEWQTSSLVPQQQDLCECEHLLPESSLKLRCCSRDEMISRSTKSGKLKLLEDATEAVVHCPSFKRAVISSSTALQG